jgi:hypothetical protein
MFTIIRPATGDRVQEGQLVVTATQPKVGVTPVAELELKFLDAPPTQAHSYPYTTIFSIDTSKLLQGYPVAQIVTGGYAGRWQVRARSGMKAVPGPWSFPVQFQLFLKQPTPSQQPMQPVPLPKSSVVQPPSQGVIAAPQMIPSPASPSQGSSGFSGMIRRRGVEGDEGTTTGDQAPTEQKP